MLHWAKFPDDPAALSLIRSASHRPLASRKDGISPCASKDLSLNLSLNSASVESTASRSRVARLPLRHCRQLQRSSPFLSRSGRQQLLPRPCRCHRPTENRATLVKAPTLPSALLAPSRFAGHHGPSSLSDCITQSWWKAHQKESLPRYPSWSVSSSSSVQQPSSVVSSPSGASRSK